ncbi:MAG: aminopeptidase P family protein [Bacteroidales bacterium]|nr:aminopeptidase P family protein [Bacteroidales bacterium]MDE7127704.1 aminopeptidase P family protein [Bacteroidales bacterium]
MFNREVYQNRRRILLEKMADKAQEGKRGIAIFTGNVEAPQNYRGNDYKFRQESSFLYYWGIDEPGFAAILDLDNGEEAIYGNDVDIDDIIWMGPQPSVQSKAEKAGVHRSAPAADFDNEVRKAVSQGRPVHFLPTSRYYNTMKVSSLLGIPAEDVRKVAPVSCGKASEELVRAIISMRLIKEPCEISEIDKACEIGYLMHTAARQGCKPGTPEQEIVGRMEGVTISRGWGVSFTTILSQHGETLHNHSHNMTITPGNLLLVDAGAESNTHYASDFTRTYPCSGRFTQRQRDIYDIVENCNELAFKLCRPGTTYRDIHIAVAKNMLEGLKSLDIVRGDVDSMAAEGIAGLFMPHGLGHNMGIDVHDMEDLGENLVGYDDDQKRSSQLGLGSLRMARRLHPGHVITDEPGIYFIPALIAKWKEDGTDKGFVNYQKLEAYNDFGGIRLEDDILITEDGARHLGPHRLPIKADDVENAMAGE